MGMDLQNKEGEWFQCRGVAWRMTLILARNYGWQPVGTLPPLEADGSEPQDLCIIKVTQPSRFLSYCLYYIKKLTNRTQGYWDSSNYTSNDGQRVTDADAHSLAEVLLHVREGVKGTEMEEHYIGDPEKWFSEFITYFRKGGFSIH
jgi:hypothetical protein